MAPVLTVSPLVRCEASADRFAVVASRHSGDVWAVVACSRGFYAIRADRLSPGSLPAIVSLHSGASQ